MNYVWSRNLQGTQGDFFNHLHIVIIISFIGMMVPLQELDDTVLTLRGVKRDLEAVTLDLSSKQTEVRG